jgi:hypothetical protein
MEDLLGYGSSESEDSGSDSDHGPPSKRPKVTGTAQAAYFNAAPDCVPPIGDGAGGLEAASAPLPSAAAVLGPGGLTHLASILLTLLKQQRVLLHTAV